MHPDLFPYQRTGAAFLAGRPVGFLFDAMGVGKTPQAVAALDAAGLQRATVICPAIARENWRREILRWQTRSRTVAVVTSGADLRKVSVMAADVLVLAYSAFSRDGWKPLLDRDAGALILDEAHYLKTPDSARTKAVYGRRLDRAGGLAGRASHGWLLTGTPVPNNAGELYTHLRALLAPEMEAAGFPLRHMDFLERFCHVQQTDYGPRILGNRNSDTLAAFLRPHVLRRRLEDVQTDLPPLRWGQVVLAPDRLPARPPEAVEAETVLAAALAKARKDESDAGLDAIAAAESVHLASLRRWTGVAKAQAVADLLREEIASGLDSCVVFAVHAEVIETICSALGADTCAMIYGQTRPAIRQHAIDAFQGRVPSWRPRVLVCQLAIAATALTLTASANVLFAETSWTPADIAQAAKRCHRIGQTRPVLARIAALRGSIDETVSASLARKASEIAKLEVALAATAV